MKRFFWIFVVVILGVGFYFKSDFYHKKTAPQEIIPPQTITVNVQKLQSVPLVLSHTYIGSVIPIHSVEIRPFISGFVEEVYVNGGDFVEVDQPLFLLEQSQYIAQKNLKEANVFQAVADLQNAKTYYERLKQAGDNAVPQSDLDAAKAKFLSATAAFGAAVAGYDAAQVMYDYTFINAPISGVLGNVSTTKGQYVSPEGSALAYLVQTTPVRVVFSIPNTVYLREKEVNNLFADKKIRLKLADGQFYDITGKVQFLDNIVNATTDSVRVFADFENTDRLLLPNAYVDVLVEENIPNALVVPQKFVSMKQNGYFVWVVGADGLLHEKQIEVSEQTVDKSFYYVTNGLEEGEFIVTQKPTQTDIPVQIKIEPTELPVTISVNSLNGESL